MCIRDRDSIHLQQKKCWLFLKVNKWMLLLKKMGRFCLKFMTVPSLTLLELNSWFIWLGYTLGRTWIHYFFVAGNIKKEVHEEKHSGLGNQIIYFFSMATKAVNNKNSCHLSPPFCSNMIFYDNWSSRTFEPVYGQQLGLAAAIAAQLDISNALGLLLELVTALRVVKVSKF